MRIYLAAPLFTFNEQKFNQELKSQFAENGLELYLPQETTYSGDDKRVIASLDLTLISNCDAVFAVCDGPDVDSGTAFEIGYATAKGMKVVVYRHDKRPYFNAMIAGTQKCVTSITEAIEHFKNEA